MKARKEQIVKLAKFLSFSMKSERRPRASISENFLPFAGGGVFGKKSAIAAPIRASAEAQQSGSSVESNFSKPKSETAASETSAELAQPIEPNILTSANFEFLQCAMASAFESAQVGMYANMAISRKANKSA